MLLPHGEVIGPMHIDILMIGIKIRILDLSIPQTDAKWCLDEGCGHRATLFMFGWAGGTGLFYFGHQGYYLVEGVFLLRLWLGVISY